MAADIVWLIPHACNALQQGLRFPMFIASALPGMCVVIGLCPASEGCIDNGQAAVITAGATLKKKSGIRNLPAFPGQGSTFMAKQAMKPRTAAIRSESTLKTEHTTSSGHAADSI